MTQAVLKLVWPASSNKTYIWPVEDSALKCRLQTSVLCDTSHCHDCCFLWDTLTHIVCDITFTRLPWDMSHWHDYTAVMWNKIYSSHVVWCVTSHIDITVAAVSCLTHQTTWLLCILCHMTTLYLVSHWHDCRVFVAAPSVAVPVPVPVPVPEEPMVVVWAHGGSRLSYTMGERREGVVLGTSQRQGTRTEGDIQGDWRQIHAICHISAIWVSSVRATLRECVNTCSVNVLMMYVCVFECHVVSSWENACTSEQRSWAYRSSSVGFDIQSVRGKQHQTKPRCDCVVSSSCLQMTLAHPWSVITKLWVKHCVHNP